MGRCTLVVKFRIPNDRAVRLFFVLRGKQRWAAQTIAESTSTVQLTAFTLCRLRARSCRAQKRRTLRRKARGLIEVLGQPVSLFGFDVGYLRKNLLKARAVMQVSGDRLKITA